MTDNPQTAYPGYWATVAPDRAAYVMAESGEITTYRDLHEEACRLAQLFRSHGLKVGDNVAFCMENHPRFLAVAWGAHYAGLYYTALSSRLTTEEAAYIVNDCGATAFITSSYKSDVAIGLLEITPDVQLRLTVDAPIEGHESYVDAIAAMPSTELDDATEGMDMLYSSGTTGQPKGVKVRLPDTPLGSPNTLYLLVTGLFGANADTIYLSPAPLYHAAPLRFCMTVQRAGGTVIVMEHFNAEAALQAIAEHHVTFVQMVPTMFVKLLKLGADVRAKYDVTSLRSVVHAAAPCPIAVKEQMIEWWGPVIHEYYAGTEGNGFCYANSEDWLAHKGTVGRSLLGPVHIVDDTGAEVSAGEPGTIYFEAASAFEYHNDDAKTADAYNDKGWSTLGDVGYVDADGFLYLTDRKAYMIITGGVNVYPQEAENVLTMHPYVDDVAVFGVPDDEFGEQVKAVVQLRGDVDASDAVERELIDYCKERLAAIKCPRSVDFRDELPRHPTGKLYKRLLRDEYWRDAGRSI